MKIGILSDSHDNLPLIRRAVECLQAAGVEMLIHVGDFIAPFAVKELLKFDGPVIGCFGNNDGERVGIRKIWPGVAASPHRLELGGRKLLLVHDRSILGADEAEGVDVVIFGHTHKPVIENVKQRTGNCLFVNPGECGGWLTGRATVAVLDTSKLEARILEL